MLRLHLQSVREWDLRNTSIIVLCLSGTLVKAQGRQAFATSPVVEARLLVALEATVGGARDSRLTVNLQHPIEQAGYHHPQHWHRQRGCLYFSPAWFPPAGTSSPA